MNYLDIVFLIILLVSGGISFLRGFVRETFSLIGWFSASWVAVHFSPIAQEYLHTYFDVAAVRMVIAFVALFIATLVVFALVNHLLAQLVEKVGLSAFNRLIGLIFGLVRAMLIIVVIVLVGNFMDWPDKKTRDASILYPYAAPIAEWVRQKLPDDIRRKLAYDTQNMERTLCVA